MTNFIAGIFFTAISAGIVWLAFWTLRIEEQLETTNNLLGEIKMKQEEFDQQITALNNEVESLRNGQSTIQSTLENEAAEIDDNFARLNQQIADLQAQLDAGTPLDTSALAVSVEALRDVAAGFSGVSERIGGLAQPVTTDTSGEGDGNPTDEEETPPEDVPPTEDTSGDGNPVSDSETGSTEDKPDEDSV